jgi:putative phosphoribosyl transferase
MVNEQSGDRSTFPFDADIEVSVGTDRLGGHLTVPDGSGGIVIFAHGSGSSRFSRRNRLVAASLNRAGLGTLLFDLLTGAEEADRTNVFDIDLLGHRLRDTTRWLGEHEAAEGLRVGYFGASTGAAAALLAAAELGEEVSAIVSRGGRPDLAGPWLPKVRAPTLLIVGSRDRQVLKMNRSAQAKMKCESRLEVVRGATHLFEEPGAMDVVAELAQDWFIRHVLKN